MQITVTGTTEEIERVKKSLEFNCFFNSEFCSEYDLGECRECEKRHNLNIEYIEKNENKGDK